MSGCPENDLHSIYLDGEMPEKFVREYESHLANCPECQAKLNKLKKLSSIYREDAISCRLDNIYLEQSFDRLQTKLKYSQNTNHLKTPILSFPVKWSITSVAAAAVFAFIFTPLYFKSAPAQQQELKAIARTEIKPITENKVVVDGNIDQTKIASALSSKPQEPAPQNSQKVVAATSLASGGRPKTGPVEKYPDIDVFHPDFNNSPASVRIEMVDIHTIPLNQAGKFESR